MKTQVADFIEDILNVINKHKDKMPMNSGILRGGIENDRVEINFIVDSNKVMISVEESKSLDCEILQYKSEE